MYQLLKRLNNETLLTEIKDERFRFDTKVKILECVSKRMYNGITQEDVADMLDVSVSTIKRFESLKVDSLSLYMNYRKLFEDLQNKKSSKVPSWVFSD